MCDPVAQVHQGGQQSVDEHQPVPSTGSDRPPARPIGQPRVLMRLPARPELGDQLRQHFPGQSGHSAIGDSGGSRQRPGHTTTLPPPSRTSRPANHARGRRPSTAPPAPAGDRYSVGPGAGQEPLVREWLGGRAVQHPVGLPRVELSHRLQEDDGSAQRGDEPVRRAPAPATTGTATPVTSSVTSNRLKAPLRGGALAVVPVELVHQLPQAGWSDPEPASGPMPSPPPIGASSALRSTHALRSSSRRRRCSGRPRDVARAPRRMTRPRRR